MYTFDISIVDISNEILLTSVILICATEPLSVFQKLAQALALGLVTLSP